MNRFQRLMAIAMVIALPTAACGMDVLGGESGEPTTMTVTAVFSDVIDLVPQHSVRAGDVTVGIVDSIELLADNGREGALVTMTVDRDLGLPANTSAELRKTGLLGERFVDLRKPEFGAAGSLTDGQRITNTRLATDFEDLTRAGGDVLAFVSADRLGAAVETGAIAFGGRQALVGRFIDDINAFVGTYKDNTDVLLALIDSLDAFAAAYAENSVANAAVLADLQAASEAFEQEDDKLLDTLEDVTRLSQVGGDFLAENQDEIASNLRRVRRLLNALTEVDGGLEGLLEWLPRHNLSVPNGAVNEGAQVWLDFIVCGINETNGDESRDCESPNPGVQGTDPGFHPFDPPCFNDFSKCEGSPQSGGTGYNDGYQG